MSNRFNLHLTGAAVAFALATLAGPTLAREGYVTHTPQAQVVTTSSGECVRTAFWTPADAALPCDMVRVVNVPPPPVARGRTAPGGRARAGAHPARDRASAPAPGHRADQPVVRRSLRVRQGCSCVPKARRSSTRSPTG